MVKTIVKPASLRGESPDEVDYYLRFGDGPEKVTLVKSSDAFTVIINDEAQKDQLLQKISKLIAQKHMIEHIARNVHKVTINNLNLAELDKIMDNVRKQMPDVIVSHVYHKRKGGKASFYLTDEIIATFAEGLSQGEIKKIEEKYQVERVWDYKEYKFLPRNTFLLRVKKTANGNPIKIANTLVETEAGVLGADPNLISTQNRRRTDTEEDAEEAEGEEAHSQWHLNGFDDLSGLIKKEAGINADGAWQLLKERKNLDGGDPEIVVAIVDWAFRVTHDALKNRLIPGFEAFDFVTGDENNAFQAPTDHHGTRCAGVVFASEPDSDIRGIAYGCSFLPVKIPKLRDDRLLIEIAEKAGEKADVISCSIMPEPDDCPPLHPLLFNAFKNIAKTGGPREKGCVLCFAAGNFNLPVKDNITGSIPWCNQGESQSPYSGEIFNPYADHPDIITVSATTSTVEKAPYSSYGNEVSLCAPADNYGACARRIVVNRKGPGIWTTDLRQAYTDRFGGTSCAAPLVAGVAALVLSANPELTAVDVRKILEGTADQINLDEMEATNSPGKYKRKATGNLTGRDHSIWFGFGKVNAAAAVENALNFSNT